MDKKIKRAYENIEFPEELKQNTLERIVSGNSRKEVIKMKKTGKTKKTASVIVAVTAAMALSVTAGAAAYKAFFHNDSVKMFGIDDESKAEQLVIGSKSAENEHFRLTADTVLSDGRTVNIVFTLEGLDEKGKAYVKTTEDNMDAPPVMFYSSNADLLKDNDRLTDSDQVKRFFTGVWYTEGNDSDSTVRKLNSDGSFAFMESDYFTSIPGKLFVAPNPDGKADDPSIFNGLVLELDVSKNLDVKEFSNGDSKLYLSKIGVTVVDDGNVVSDEMDMTHNKQDKYVLNFADGSSRSINKNEGAYSFKTAEYGYSYFFDSIDIDSVKSVTFDGVEFK